MIVPFDLIALGTRAAMLETAAGAAAEDDALVVGEAAADDDELLLLLLPHPTIATALSSEMVTESQLLRVLIAVLLIDSSECRRRIGNIAFTGGNV